MNKKALIFGGGAIAIVAIVVALIFIFTGGEDAYRSIKVFEIDGSCKVDRGGDSLDAFKNMALSSGDSLTVGEGSFARLKLDDDKYVYLEANTKINLTATGTANDSKTMVYIERGSMLTEVKKKLSATSSYDIVTPNTTMSIRGTKTLTQVLEDAVTGHVQTSNAVLEGQVKIKAVKVKADGTVVSVEKDLGAGEGNAFSSNKEELVSQEEMKSIADTGASVNGIKVEIVSEEDADVVFDVATFEASFLENVKNILVADAQAETGEEGLSQEQIDAINAQLGEVLESFDVISTESQNAINAAASGEAEPEPTPEITPEPTPEATSESLWSWENIAATETDDTQDEGTTIVDGDTSLLVIDDADEADDTADRDNGADEVATEDDDNDDAADEDDEEADETDEDEVSDEDDNAGEDDVDDADDADDEDKSDEEGEEENTDEEDADKEDGEDEEAEDEESEDEESEEEPKDDSEDGETSEESGETPAEQTTQSTPSSGSGTSTGGTTATSRMSYNDTTTTVEYSFGSNQQTVSVPVKVSFYTGDENNKQRISMNSLPTTSLQPGNALPGCMWSDYKAEIVPATSAGSGSHADEEVGYYYSFTGWYASEAEAASNDLSKRYTTYSSELANVGQLYPGICRTARLHLLNTDPYMGYVQFPTDSSLLDGNIVSWEPAVEGVQAVVKAGTTISLPLVETHSAGDSVAHAYVKLKQSHAQLFCYIKPDYNSQVEVPDIAGLYLGGNKPATAEGASEIYYASDNPTISIGENDEFIQLKMYYVAPVEVRVADFEGSGIVNVKKTGDPSTQTESLGRFYAAATQNSSISEPIVELPGVNDSVYKWKLTKTAEAYTVGGVKYDLYTFKTAFSQAYDTDLRLPQLSVAASADSGSYKKEFLSTYRVKDNNPVTTFITSENDEPMAISSLWDYQSIDPVSFDPLEDFDGRYIFTYQPVDWVYIDMSPTSVPAGVEQGHYCFKVGNNNPFVIPDQDSESTGKYKFAVNSIDLHTELGTQPQMEYAIQPVITPETNSSRWTKFIYAPDDILYPYNNLGEARYTEYGTNPLNIYNSSVIAPSVKNAYSFLGVEGYKLAGYVVEYPNNNTTGSFSYWLGENDNYQSGGYAYGNIPVRIIGTNESVANMMDLSVIGAYIGNVGTYGWSYMSAPVTLKPVFVQVNPVVAKLEYSEEADMTYGSYSAKVSVVQNYTLILEGVDKYSCEKIGLDLRGIKVDYFNNNTPGSNKIDNRLCWSSGSASFTLLNHNEASVTLNTDDFSFDDNSGTYRLKLNKLSINANELQPGGVLGGTNVFVRGLLLNEDSGDTVTVSNYRPRKIKVTPGNGESYKYSAFVYPDGTNAYKYGRVFTASDTFSSSTSRFNSTGAAGVIMDMCGAENYSYAYYGGEVLPLYRQQNVLFGSSEGLIESSEILSFNKVVDRLALIESTPSNIVSYLLGENYTGYSGLFEFRPYNQVTIKNCIESDTSEKHAAYAYMERSTPINDDNNSQIGYKVMPSNDGKNSYGTYFGVQSLYRYSGSQVNNDGDLVYNICGDSYVYDVPEGFIYQSVDTDKQIIIYYGNNETATYTYTNDQNKETTEYLYPHRAIVEFGYRAV